MITSKTCTKCHQFKKLIEERHLTVEIEDVETLSNNEVVKIIERTNNETKIL